MPNTPQPGTERSRPVVSSDVARGLPLAVYSLVGGVVAVGVSSVVIWWVGGNPLDWLALLVILVLAGGWYAPSLLRRLYSWRR